MSITVPSAPFAMHHALVRRLPHVSASIGNRAHDRRTNLFVWRAKKGAAMPSSALCPHGEIERTCDVCWIENRRIVALKWSSQMRLPINLETR